MVNNKVNNKVTNNKQVWIKKLPRRTDIPRHHRVVNLEV